MKHLAYPNEILLYGKVKEEPGKVMKASGMVLEGSGLSFFKISVLWAFSLSRLNTVGMQMKYGIYNDVPILRWWHTDVDGALDPCSCFK